MTHDEVLAVAEIINGLPVCTQQYDESKSIMVSKMAQLLREKKKPDYLIARFCEKCWVGW